MLLIHLPYDSLTCDCALNPCPAEPVFIKPAFANSVDPDQLASEEANLSGSTLFVIEYVNLCQQSDWLKVRSGCCILIYFA